MARNLVQSPPESTGKAYFEALLKSLESATENDAPDSSETQREEWISHLTDLYKQIEVALSPYVADGHVKISYRPITLVEPYVGEYTVDKMLIKFAHTEIVLEPIGTMLIGSKGRVDVIGPFGTSSLLLLNKKARRLSDMFQVRVTMGNTPPTSIRPAPEPSEPVSWEWRIVSKSASRELISLNQEVLLGLFAEVANG